MGVVGGEVGGSGMGVKGEWGVSVIKCFLCMTSVTSTV